LKNKQYTLKRETIASLMWKNVSQKTPTPKPTNTTTPKAYSRVGNNGTDSKRGYQGEP